ncbi:acyltransferase domain-containing protein [Streptosporangium vulgare]|uniref:acyltransferase domain-containing protein n=1 Tax=Streptosporangium vulgare TaxID=46190 RepID=UPI003CD092ED
MGAGLLESSPVFAQRFAECAEALEPFVDCSVVDAVRGGGGLERVEVVQPVLWAVMVSLARVWRSLSGWSRSRWWGIRRGRSRRRWCRGGCRWVMGARVVALRSRLLGGVAGRGGMASVALPARSGGGAGRGVGWGVGGGGERSGLDGGVRESAERWRGFVAGCEAAGVRTRVIAVDYASHSAQMEEIG